jgi:hypothetical protein
MRQQDPEEQTIEYAQDACERLAFAELLHLCQPTPESAAAVVQARQGLVAYLIMVPDCGRLQADAALAVAGFFLS